MGTISGYGVPENIAFFTNTGTIAGDMGINLDRTNHLLYLDYYKIKSTICIAVKLFHNTAQAIPNSVWTPIAFNTERFDEDTMHDINTNTTRITIKTAGLYSIKGCIQWAANAVGTRGLTIKVNGNIYLDTAFRNANTGGIEHSDSVSDFYKFNVNDYLELVAYQTSGADLNINSYSDYSPSFGVARMS